MQEAYRLPCSKYSLCCPTWVPPRQGTPPSRVPPSQGTPWQGTPWQGTPLPGYPPSARVSPLAGPGRVPPLPGYPPSQGTPQARVPPKPGYPLPPGYPPSWTWQGTPPPLPAGPGRVRPPPAAPWHSGKCCKALWDTGTLPRCGLTNKVKLLPSRRTTYAGGN